MHIRRDARIRITLISMLVVSCASGCTLPQQGTAGGFAAGCTAGSIVAGRDGCAIFGLAGGAIGWAIGKMLQRELKVSADRSVRLERQIAQLKEALSHNKKLISDIKEQLKSERDELNRLRNEVDDYEDEKSKIQEEANLYVKKLKGLEKYVKRKLEANEKYLEKLERSKRQQVMVPNQKLRDQLKELLEVIEQYEGSVKWAVA